MALQIRLDNFSGPLDLLLHLIKSHEMDICDIRIFEITEQYLAIINQMKQLDLDVAGEFLMMAATLLHIKSRMLLPLSDEAEEEQAEDPRAELVKRLLEYQRYREAGQLFDRLSQLERDVFLPRLTCDVFNPQDFEQEPEVAASIFQLAHAFHQLLKNVQPEIFHEVVRESLSVADTIEKVRQHFFVKSRLAFRDIIPLKGSRTELIVTFLAILELIKMRILEVEQVASFSEIWLSRAVPPEQMVAVPVDRGVLDYG